MSVYAVASLRPLQGRCLRHATSGLLSLQVKSPVARFSIRAIIPLVPQQRRHQSSSPGSGGKPENNDKPGNSPAGGSKESSKPAQSQMTLTQFIRMAVGASFKNLIVALSPRGVQSAYRDSPVLTSLSVAFLIALLIISIVSLRAFVKAFYGPEFSRYPKPIANSLRRAIYYTNIKPDPELALRFYRQAIEQCTEHGLDPFSDEVLGIRIQISMWLQKVNSFKSAIDNLEAILADCRKWVDVMELSVKDGKVDDKGRYRPDSQTLPMARPAQPGQDKVAPTSEDPVPEESETLWRKRQRLLAKAIGTSVKLGELYADEHVLDPDKSHKHLVWAVETAMQEFQRRRTQGIKPGEKEWLTREEFGGSMESLGRDYERKSQFHLAIPLFFQALRLCESPCHRPVIMNNISAAFAQHPIYTPAQIDASETLQGLLDPAMPKTRDECLDAALNWAQNAYTHAKDVKGEERTAECDEACAVALCNWGDVAAMLGKTELARKKYKECIEMSGKIEFPQGVESAQEGLARLTSTPSSRI
ncbi:hypothetical protein HIM_01049 [Hirsutella minnesotensis 3608]|nr:hypothetical protein HIM_01049 [Hirsutella minnesotensis 3608]